MGRLVKSCMSLAVTLAVALSLPIAQAGGVAIFDFESVAAGTATPFSTTAGSITASFSGGSSVCPSNNLFANLSGNVLIQAFCSPFPQPSPLTISFSSDLDGASFYFAVANGPGSLTLQAFKDALLVGSAVFPTSLPPGAFTSEGFASLNLTLDSLVVTSDRLFAIDMLEVTASAVPEPPMVVLLGGAALLGFGLTRRKANPKESAQALSATACGPFAASAVPCCRHRPLSDP